MISKQKLLWIGLILAILIGVIWEFYPLSDAKKRLDSLPLRGTGFEGFSVPLTPVERTFFEGVNIVKRIYKVGDQQFFIYVLDGTHNRHAVHDPTFCFRGAGWDIEKETTIPLSSGSALLVDIKKAEVEKEAMIWFSDGKTNFSSALKYWWLTTLRRLTLGKSGEEPVLISIQPILTESLNYKEIFEKIPELNHI